MSFIGSHLVDALVARGARVRVVDNLSSGRTENIKKHIEAGKIEFQNENLADTGAISRAMAGMKIVFHLAADHGGAGRSCSGEGLSGRYRCRISL